jgi:hypothetical protein
MSEAQIRAYAETKAFHAQTLERWLTWQEADREPLLGLVIGLKIGENHLRDLMDWLEEIALRDKTPIAEVLSTKPIGDIASDPRLGRADKLKRIKEQIRRRRFPRLAQTEDEISGRIKDLQLAPEIRLSVPPGLETGRVHVEFSAATHDELIRLTNKLAQAVQQDAARTVFKLLGGNSAV